MVSIRKSLKVRVCICGVGTYELMFSCNNMSAVSQKIVRSGEAVFSLQYVLQHLVWPFFVSVMATLCVCML